jgi:pimeloyl-ACP methyl ester carboxylesterase
MHPKSETIVLAAILLLARPMPGCAGDAAARSQTKETKMSRGYAPVNGLKIYYEIHGESDGPPLVVLHGGGSTIETSFGKLLPRLATSRRVIAFEQQGHGRTADIADRPFSFDQSADDTAKLLAYLKVDQADFLGYSNGGHIALQIALSHPSLVRKLIIESAMFSKDGSDPSFWGAFDHAKINDMPAELREAYLRSAPNPENLQSFFEKSVERMKRFQGWSEQDIKSIKAPALILLGDRDIVRPEHAVLMLRLMGNAQLAILPNTDHMSIVNRADEIGPMVEAFLNSETRSASPPH